LPCVLHRARAGPCFRRKAGPGMSVIGGSHYLSPPQKRKYTPIASPGHRQSAAVVRLVLHHRRALRILCIRASSRPPCVTRNCSCRTPSLLFPPPSILPCDAGSFDSMEGSSSAEEKRRTRGDYPYFQEARAAFLQRLAEASARKKQEDETSPQTRRSTRRRRSAQQGSAAATAETAQVSCIRQCCSEPVVDQGSNPPVFMLSQATAVRPQPPSERAPSPPRPQVGRPLFLQQPQAPAPAPAPATVPSSRVAVRERSCWT
jgi:hypothetical protein